MKHAKLLSLFVILTACSGKKSDQIGALSPADPNTGSILAPQLANITSRAPNSGSPSIYFDIEGTNLGGNNWDARLERNGENIPLTTTEINQSRARLVLNAAAQLLENVAYNLVISNAYGQSVGVVSTLKGDKGDPGSAGATGTAGTPGAQGPQGIQGIAGVKGDKGDKGEVGTQGAVGLPGAKGDKGDVGPVGPAGPQGTPGLKGESGLKPWTAIHRLNLQRVFFGYNSHDAVQLGILELGQTPETMTESTIATFYVSETVQSLEQFITRRTSDDPKEWDLDHCDYRVRTDRSVLPCEISGTAYTCSSTHYYEYNVGSINRPAGVVNFALTLAVAPSMVRFTSRSMDRAVSKSLHHSAMYGMYKHDLFLTLEKRCRTE